MGDFATLVVQWQKTHGRNQLPWQNTRDPYRVWLSEIMLQQTQVATVKAYFARFLARCPDVASLAAASLDEVLGLWSGLGYYSRARNLHRCAQDVMQLHGGRFPQDAQTLQTLPGIGRSTAAAIASLCFSERVAILDANVKRVVTRVQGFDADVAVAANARALWDVATALLPAPKRAAQDMARYTLDIVRIGAPRYAHPRSPNANYVQRSNCVWRPSWVSQRVSRCVVAHSNEVARRSGCSGRRHATGRSGCPVVQRLACGPDFTVYLCLTVNRLCAWHSHPRRWNICNASQLLPMC